MLRLNKTKAEAFKIAYSFPGVNSYLLKVLIAIPVRNDTLTK